MNRCRICLRSVYIGHLMGLFDPTFTRILKKFELIIGQEVQQSPQLPNQICEVCIREITNACMSIDNWAQIQSRLNAYQWTHVVPTFIPVISTNGQNNGGPPNAVVQPFYSNLDVLKQDLVNSNYATANDGINRQENSSSSNVFQGIHSDHKFMINNDDCYSDNLYNLENNIPFKLLPSPPNEECFGFDIEQAEAVMAEIFGDSNRDYLAMKAPLSIDSPETFKSDIIDPSVAFDTKELVGSNATSNISQQNINFTVTYNSNFGPQNSNFVTTNSTNTAKFNPKDLSNSEISLTAIKNINNSVQKSECSYFKTGEELLDSVHVKLFEDTFRPSAHATYNNNLDMKGINFLNNTNKNSADLHINESFDKTADVCCQFKTTEGNQFKSPKDVGSELRHMSGNNTTFDQLNIEIKNKFSRTETFLEITGVSKDMSEDLVANENKTYKKVNIPEHNIIPLISDTNETLSIENCIPDVDKNTTASSSISKTPTIDITMEAFNKLIKSNENKMPASLTLNTIKNDNLKNNELNESINQTKLNDINATITSKNYLKMCGIKTKSNFLKKIYARDMRANDLRASHSFKDSNVSKGCDITTEVNKCNELPIGLSKFSLPNKTTNRFDTLTTPPPLVPCQLKIPVNVAKKHKLVDDKAVKHTNGAKNLIKIGGLTHLSQESTRPSNVSYFEVAKTNKGDLKISSINRSLVTESQLTCDKNRNERPSDKTLTLSTLLSDECFEQSDLKIAKPTSANSFGHMATPKKETVEETQCTLIDITHNENIVHTGLQTYKLSDSELNQTGQKEYNIQASSPSIGNGVLDIDEGEQQPKNLWNTDLEYENKCHSAPEKAHKISEPKKAAQKKNPPITNLSAHQCHYCPRAFPSKRSKAVHERCHTKEILCCYCGLKHLKGCGCRWTKNTR